MGAVRSSLVLNDGMSPALRRINSAMSLVLNNFEAVQRASGKSMNTANIAAARQEIGKANAALDQMEQNYRDCNNQQDQLNKSISTGSSNANGLMSKIKGIAGAFLGIKALSGLVGLSDTLTSNAARLELIVDDGGSVAELQQKIYDSAQGARASYTDVMGTVAKLGVLAGKAFSNNDEIIKFQELVNKNFVVGGASAQEQTAAVYQLTQSMAAGKLQGDEYKTIRESAPLLSKSIEDYMTKVKGLSGTMKDWAADGKLTTDVIKAAVFSSADEVEERFNKIPKRWSDIWTNMKNRAVISLGPVLTKINELANDPNFQNGINGMLGGFAMIAGVLLGVFNLVSNIYNFIANNWGWIGPLIMGIVSVLALYKLATLLCAAAEWFSFSAKIANALASGAATVMLNGEKVATEKAAMAQWGLNSALFACPFVWIILLVIALIVIFYAVIGAINHFAGTSISATGAIFGAFCVLGAAIWNIIVGVIDAVIQFLWTYFVEPWIGIIEWVLNVFNGGFDSFGDGVKNLLGNIISWFLSLGKVVTKIIDAIFGTNWTDGLSAMQDSVLSWGKNEKAVTLSREAPTIQSLTGGKVDRWAYSDAWNVGYKAGESVDKAVAGMFNFNDLTKGADIPGADQFANTPDTLGDIAGDTSDLAKNSDKTTEELAYLRDIAEKEAVNRFTTAEIKVDMTGMSNRIDGKMDIDGVISYLSDGLVDALSTAAEGVY